MNDQIHGRWVAKAHTASPAAFLSPGLEPPGHIAEGGVSVLVWLGERLPLFNPVPRRRARVGLVTVALGDDDVLTDTVAGHVDGLVVAVLCGARLRRAVDSDSSADPASLMARARPEARHEVRTANLANRATPSHIVCIEIVMPDATVTNNVRSQR